MNRPPASRMQSRRTLVAWVSLSVIAMGCGRAGGDAAADAEPRVVLPPGMTATPGTNADARPPAVPFSAATPRTAPRVLAHSPHDTAAFTQGLVFYRGRLYESTGIEGRSQVRELDPATGAVRRRVALPAADFGEGIAAVGSRLCQVTWRRGRGYVYDLPSLARVDSFAYAGEGWGLASDGRVLYMSDGSSRLRVIDPAGFRELRRVQVTEAGQPVWGLNELEWVRGELWANVFETPLVARIDPATGAVRGWLDLSALAAQFTPAERAALDSAGGVANGIAYDGAAGTLVVTGKLWPELFRIAAPAPDGAAATAPVRR